LLSDEGGNDDNPRDSSRYRSSEFGGALAESSMAMCEGQRGWEDYLLLHHYDPAVQLDRLPGA
jgi:hypothetical protein